MRGSIRRAISREEVLHVARLARLALTDEEVERLTEELDLVNVWDEDEPRASLALDDVFANAPDREGDHFRVPPVGE